ncbi:MAG: hypothetical protein PHS92_01130 [Candidatus Gracilibacteria bacterium]|nr:hypothetical protein [Candidatus Gracilibacteria bacterium]
MKQIFEDKIINIDNDLFDNRFLFKIAISPCASFDYDMSKLLLDRKNGNLDYSKDLKLWSEVYSPKNEFEIFSDLIEENIRNNKKIHISDISLQEEVHTIRDLYIDLGYFNADLNRFEVDLENAPVTIGTNINSIIYSFKDYNTHKEKIFFIPPPREPRHQKTLKSGINSSLISTVRMNGNDDEIEFLKQIIKDEKISPLKLSRSIFFNYGKIGFEFLESDIIIDFG